MLDKSSAVISAELLLYSYVKIFPFAYNVLEDVFSASKIIKWEEINYG